MTIEDRLRACRPQDVSVGLKAKVLTACRPWRPGYLVAAAAILLCLILVNQAIDSRLRAFLQGSTDAARPRQTTASALEDLDFPGSHVLSTLAASCEKKAGYSLLDSLSDRMR